MNAMFLQDLANTVTACNFWLLALLTFMKCSLSAVVLHYTLGLVTSLTEHTLATITKFLLFAAGQEVNAHIKSLLWFLGFGSLTSFPLRSTGYGSEGSCKNDLQADGVAEEEVQPCLLPSHCKASGFSPYPQMCVPDAEIQREDIALRS